jgi:hypothetical protein
MFVENWDNFGAKDDEGKNTGFFSVTKVGIYLL